MNPIIRSAERVVKALTEQLLGSGQHDAGGSYLSEASDIGELERRMRALERQTSDGAQMKLEYLAYARH